MENQTRPFLGNRGPVDAQRGPLDAQRGPLSWSVLISGDNAGLRQGVLIHGDEHWAHAAALVVHTGPAPIRGTVQRPGNAVCGDVPRRHNVRAGTVLEWLSLAPAQCPRRHNVRAGTVLVFERRQGNLLLRGNVLAGPGLAGKNVASTCLLYTSDAADE